MDCRDVRPQLLDYQRGRLAPDLHGAVRAHLEGCADCTRYEAVEQALTDALSQRLPQYPASRALKARLAVGWPAPASPKRVWWDRWGRTLAVAGVLLVALPLYYGRGSPPAGSGAAGMVTEAVNDHLRLLHSQHPLDIESGGMHQVKPWFEGRLDFAPVVSFLGDDEFPLRGGAVGYFLDREAAVFVFARRLHRISLLVFRAEGLAWPTRSLEPMGKVRAYGTAARGFGVLLGRDGELGYALVSDVEATELRQLGAKLAGGA